MAKLEKNTNYFASMTDMMVGILFVFIIMIAYFAFQIQQSEAVPKEIHDQVVKERNSLKQLVAELQAKIDELESIIAALRLELGEKNQTIEEQEAKIQGLRIEIGQLKEDLDDQEKEITRLKIQIDQLKKELERLKLNPLQRFVEASSNTRDRIVKNVIQELNALNIDAKSVQRGVVTISGKGLFASGRSDLDSVPTAKSTVDKISEVVSAQLECFFEQARVFAACEEVIGIIDSIYIEGHTDNGKVLGQLPDGSRTNLELSSRRATNTYERIVLSNPSLTQLINPADQQALSVAAYGEQRPIESNDTEKGREANRRIDLRFTMYTPDSLADLARLRPEGF